MPTALITGASRGLGRAVARDLAARGWSLVVDARDGPALDEAMRASPGPGKVVAVVGDVTDPHHRRELATAAAELAPLDLLVNNASSLGPSPLPPLDEADPEDLAGVLATNVVAPLAVYQAVRDHLSEGAVVVNVTSDAGREAYPHWGLYGASKAALDHLTAILAVERPDLAVYAFDPGDMRTRMHQDAFPGEDISDRPEPETVVPALRSLVDHRPPSGRVIAAEMEQVDG